MALFDLLGRGWAMGILWTLAEIGPATFRKLQDKCETISPGVLNTRLRELQTARLVERTDAGYIVSPLGLAVYDALVPLGEVAKDWAKLLDQEI
ncbi:MAG: winged helix-turn-helix transcriptional regulator [Parasphingopyxis sp.]|uniref:winged helix-turn-helix transcriptional regulator n=1 Tax=Parasphingopyxis sp. TaxID=1920299 RepID=UPI003F9FE8D5